MLFLCLSTQSNLPHVFKTSDFVTYSCFESCTPLVNGCVDCALFNAVLNVYLPNWNAWLTQQTKYRNNVPKPSVSWRKKISPVGDWRSTSLEWPWPWPWIRPNGIPSCITHRPLPTYQISLRSEEKFFRKSPVRFWSSLKLRDTKTGTNIRNQARSNLDIVL